jgi:hypothetical protein
MVAKSWAKLTLFDRVQHVMREHPGEGDPAVRKLLREARPFVITENAAVRVREAMAAYPEMIADNSAFALPPFPAMWIEYPTRTLLRHWRLTTSSEDAQAVIEEGFLPLAVHYPQDDDPTTDVRVGYLIGGNTVWVFVEGEALHPQMMPFSYVLHRPLPLDEQLAAAGWFGVSRIGLDQFLWGHTLYPTLDRKHQRMLRDQHSFLLTKDLLHSEATAEARAGVVQGCAGELRNILAILLMVNQPAKVISTREVPRTRGLVKNKPTSYWGHQLIDINLDAKTRALLARPKGAAHWHMRWHEVRGHFVHRNVRGSNHAHVWQADPERDRRWRCSEEGCKAVRTWREYPEGHGSATVGYVEQVRRVRTGRDQPASR